MALTKEMSDALKDYFPAQAHEFLQGNTYLSEEAITNRLDDVDPSWEFHRLGDFAYRDNSIIATFRLTVSGVSRDGIGMWDLTIKKKDGTLMSAVDPEKSVSTDALKRAARLFGIGRYILEMKGVNDYRTLEDWLAKRRKINPQTGEIKLVQNGTKSHVEPPSSDLAQKDIPTIRLEEFNALKVKPTATYNDKVVRNTFHDTDAGKYHIYFGEMFDAENGFMWMDGNTMLIIEAQPAKSPQDRLGTPAKQTIAPRAGKWEYDLPELMQNADVIKAYPQYEHRANAIKLLQAGGYFENVTFANAVAMMLNRPDKQAVAQ